LKNAVDTGVFLFARDVADAFKGPHLSPMRTSCFPSLSRVMGKVNFFGEENEHEKSYLATGCAESWFDSRDGIYGLES
jgi:hypothetical protein